MVRLFKEMMYLCLLLISFSLVGCNSTITENQLPESKPKNFNFAFNYGATAKNQLDTIKRQYIQDMVVEPSITTKLKLSNEEMNAIYSEMKKINIINYPETFIPKSKLMLNYEFIC